jgi:hypothetical protein
VKGVPAKAVAVVLLSLGWLGCDARLPDPQAPGAVLYAERCRGCHRLYAPGLLKSEMWKVVVDRMQGEIVRRGLPPLTPEERKVVMAYLEKHSSP